MTEVKTGEALKPSRSGHMPINGLSLYHEVYGERGTSKTAPLLLIPGAHTACARPHTTVGHSPNSARPAWESIVTSDGKGPPSRGRAVHRAATAAAPAGRTPDRGNGVRPGPGTRGATNQDHTRLDTSLVR